MTHVSSALKKIYRYDFIRLFSMETCDIHWKNKLRIYLLCTFSRKKVMMISIGQTIGGFVSIVRYIVEARRW